MTARQKKIRKVMGEFEAGTLKSSSGEIVKDPRQAMAIAMSDFPKRVLDQKYRSFP